MVSFVRASPHQRQEGITSYTLLSLWYRLPYLMADTSTGAWKSRIPRLSAMPHFHAVSPHRAIADQYIESGCSVSRWLTLRVLSRSQYLMIEEKANIGDPNGSSMRKLLNPNGAQGTPE